MHELILRNAQGHELGREPMLPDARYELGRICMEHEHIEMHGKRYKAIKGAWLIHEQDFIACVIDEGPIYVDYCDC